MRKNELKRVAWVVCLFLEIVLSSSSLLAQKKVPFRISCEVTNVKVPAKVILTVRDITEWVEFTAESQNGKFILSGSLHDPSFTFLVLKYGNELDQGPRMANVLELFIDEMPITIKTNDSLRFATIQGGTSQNEFESYQKTLPTLKQSSIADRKNSVGRFIHMYPDSFVSLYAIQNFSMDGNYILDGANAPSLFSLLSPKIKNTASGIELNKGIQIAQHTALGAMAPDFSQRDTVDKEVRLSLFRGKYVLIDFWASWCRPCRVENPSLVKIYKKYNRKNFTILSVSLDNNKTSWLKAIRKDELTWTHVSDLKFWKNEVALQYGVKTVPQNFLIDPDGKIIGRNLRPEGLEIQLNKLLH